MPRIPYYRGKELAGILRWASCFYSGMLEEVLLKGNALDMICHHLSIDTRLGKPKPWLVYMVLKHVSLRTLQFAKPIELIRHSEIINGRPDIAIPPCLMTDRWVRQILSALVAGQWLIKLTFPRSVTTSSFYGLNIPGWLWVIRHLWSESLADPSYSIKLKELDLDWLMSNSRPLNPRPFHTEVLPDPGKASGLAKRSLYMLGLLVRFVTPYRGMFQFLADERRPIQDWKEFLEDLGRLRPSRGEIDVTNGELKNKVRNCRIGRRGELEVEKEQEQDLMGF